MIGLHNRQTIIAAIIAAAALAISGSLTRASAGEGIFVPPPRGADETLDGAEPEAKTIPDIVRTVKNDVLTGKVLSIRPDGLLHLAGSQYNGEVTIVQSALDSVELAWTVAESALDKVTLTNGDHILGEVTSISLETIIVESEIAGAVKIPRNMVTSIRFALGEGTVVGSNFNNARMEPWKSRSGDWSLTDGKLHCTSSGRNDAIHAELDQKGPLTFVAKVKWPKGLRCSLVLFADSTHGQYGRNSIFTMVYNNEYHVGYTQNTRAITVARRSPGRKILEGEIRFAYDPVTSKARLWLDSTDLGEIEIPFKRTTGKYVLFLSDYPSETTYLRVLRGIVPPPENLGAGEEHKDLIEFTTKDKVSAENITLTDGKLVVKTSLGSLTPTVDKVAQIVFRRKGRQRVLLAEGDVRVHTTGSRLTLRLKELTDKHLIGVSGCYGNIKIRRSSIKAIQFKIAE